MYNMSHLQTVIAFRMGNHMGVVHLTELLGFWFFFQKKVRLARYGSAESI